MACKQETGAVIEIGTNSVKLLVARPDPENRIDIIFHTRKITRIGEGINRTGTLLPAAMERTLEAVVEFHRMALERGARTIYAVGTFALRTASNAGDFTRMVREATGIDVEIFSGDQEAASARAGATLDLKETPGVKIAVIDIGGGSTEIAVDDYRKSLHTGGLSTSETYIHHDPPLPEELNTAAASLRRLFEEGLAVKPGTPVAGVGVGGTITAAGCLKLGLPAFDAKKIDRTALTIEDIQASIDRLVQVPLEQRRTLMPCDPDRADTIIGGLLVLRTFFTYFDVKTFIVSGKSNIHGVFYQKFCGIPQNENVKTK